MITLLRSCFNFPTALAVSDTTCKQVLFEQLAKILSGGRSSQIVDLTQKLQERPTPKFSEAVASCDRASRRILIAGPSLGDWANPDGKKKLLN
ncbi:MAG: hypothetical protein M3N42_01070 [Cyanobacteriota bacterium]|nr:hypothetical protein [Cyanobacteriota bacterium]